MNHPKDRDSETAHQHSSNTRKDVSILAVRLKNPQRFKRRQQQSKADENEIGAEVKQAQSSFVHWALTPGVVDEDADIVSNIENRRTDPHRCGRARNRKDPNS